MSTVYKLFNVDHHAFFASIFGFSLSIIMPIPGFFVLKFCMLIIKHDDLNNALR